VYSEDRVKDETTPVPEALKDPERAAALVERAGLSDDALALLLTSRYRDELVYVNLWGRWLRWDGARWKHETTLVIFDLARDLLRELAPDKKTIRSAKTVNAVVSLARVDRAHARVPEDFDRWPMLLNTPAGTVDLRTGAMKAHAPGDLLTKVTPVSPGGECPIWRDCLRTWTCGDDELEAFLWRLFGYCLTGLVKEEVLPILYGPGGNGKTRFVEALRSIIGTDYMGNVAMETLIVTYGEQHPTDVASLRGRRVAVASETEEGRRLAEAKVKHLTGGERLQGRFMRQDFFEFDPTHKLIIVGNHKPRLVNLDDAIRRRLLLVPFVATIPEGKRDRDLEAKLRAEAPGILAWAIAGCLEWQQRGLAPPDSVRVASARYLEEQDDFAEWMRERIVREPKAATPKSEVFESWKGWAEAHGCAARSAPWLNEKLEALDGVVEVKRHGLRVWVGLGIREGIGAREF
jgi:putative DNA primase/helicase